MKLHYIFNKIIVSVACVATITGCNTGPKVIEAKSDQQPFEKASGIFTVDPDHIQEKPAQSWGNDDIHQVIIQEVLPTSRYVYLKVQENQREYWIATNKLEVEVGGRYFFRGGLLKTNFLSKEHNRTFDEIYLVSTIVRENHGQQNPKQQLQAKNTSAPKPAKKQTARVKGATAIAEIVAQPTEFANKTVLVSGQCSKINSNIMGRHWIHLKDGSKDDYDFVITSQTPIPVGHMVTMRGKVVLDKDFGAGYQYDIIMEEGEVIK